MFLFHLSQCGFDFLLSNQDSSDALSLAASAWSYPKKHTWSFAFHHLFSFLSFSLSFKQGVCLRERERVNVFNEGILVMLLFTFARVCV